MGNPLLVTLNLTVTSAGRQLDRLGFMYFNDAEIFRTSTAEPIQTGIEWTYMKDVSSFLALFKKPQKIIFDPGNLVDDTYTGTFNVTLTAAFFTNPYPPPAADVVLPVSARHSSVNGSSAFVVPTDNASTTLNIPLNAKKAIFTISACGQFMEELWYTNVPSSTVQTFPDTELFGHSPFRELQLYIDGILAGVSWPFPVIFTGGIVSGLWRPVVGIDAFDLREDEIDVTPFIPLLVDGKAHTFEIRVVGIDDDGTGNALLTDNVEDYWVVTGKLFLWQDDTDGIASGPAPVVIAPEPTLHLASSVTKDANGANEPLSYSVSVERYLSVSSVVSTPRGLSVDDESGDFSIAATISRGKEVRVIGPNVFPTEQLGSTQRSSDSSPTLTGTHLKPTQNGSATYLAAPKLKYAVSYGTTEQDLVFSTSEGFQPPLRKQVYGPERDYRFYRRHVLAVNGTLVEDDETIRDDGDERKAQRPYQAGKTEHCVREGVGRMLGRGPRL
ncbi:hypothetical protein H2199_004822 [Coniosporium tulheliwenetii]|uniref:Uncharacterized protein n=1 Tax=Coniosporium tulheliwenetii TaxID=3383036 RepID=A0ACC2Z545_9PEZI|nr:hypothetical protein H2199_004822 [Cladosporium sp. JES 115]